MFSKLFQGRTVAVVAGGRSALDFCAPPGCAIVAVNLSFRLHPNADMLYAGDGGFWMTYRDACRFPGLKLAPSTVDCVCPSVLRCVNVADTPDLVFEPICTVGTGEGNSGFQAMNLAVQFGARKLILAGFDFCGDHWHERHPRGLGNPSQGQFVKWRRCFECNIDLLIQRGIDVKRLGT